MWAKLTNRHLKVQQCLSPLHLTCHLPVNLVQKFVFPKFLLQIWEKKKAFPCFTFAHSFTLEHTNSYVQSRFWYFERDGMSVSWREVSDRRVTHLRTLTHLLHEHANEDLQVPHAPDVFSLPLQSLNNSTALWEDVRMCDRELPRPRDNDVATS